jgi:hypothetical protein
MRQLLAVLPKNVVRPCTTDNGAWLVSFVCAKIFPPINEKTFLELGHREGEEKVELILSW